MSTVVKCLVWDLDDTLWDGVVLEGDRPAPFPAALTTLRALDRRGILHAAASRGDRSAALAHLEAVGVAELFSALEVGWGAKSAAVARVARSLGVGLDTIAFVDNDPVERAEVTHALPAVRCYPATAVAGLPDRPEFTPAVVTDEARQRRGLYRAERRRADAERDHAGPAADFRASLGLRMTVRRATEADLARAVELTERTHQLNTTGLTYGIDELRALCAAPSHEVLVASLTDRYGSYGTIGLAVTELQGGDAVLTLLLMSCRVLNRGVGGPFLDHLVARATAAGRRAVAEFRPNDVNRMMLVTLRFAGFAVVDAGPPMRLAVTPDRTAPAGGDHVLVEAVG